MYPDIPVDVNGLRCILLFLKKKPEIVDQVRCKAGKAKRSRALEFGLRCLAGPRPDPPNPNTVTVRFRFRFVQTKQKQIIINKREEKSYKDTAATSSSLPPPIPSPPSSPATASRPAVIPPPPSAPSPATPAAAFSAPDPGTLLPFGRPRASLLAPSYCYSFSSVI